MKIYLPGFMPKNIDIENIDIENINSSIHKKSVDYCNIYSQEGLFRIQNNNVYQLIPQDIPIEKTIYNNIEFIIDKSSYIFRKNIYSIPYKHIIYNIEQHEYKLYDNSIVSLIINYCKNKIIDIYFLTKNNLCINSKNNIIEYISLFNDIKQY